MALRGEKTALYETGLRLELPDGESVPASAFLPAARRITDLIDDLGISLSCEGNRKAQCGKTACCV